MLEDYLSTGQLEAALSFKNTDDLANHFITFLGYSSITKTELQNWLIKNNFSTLNQNILIDLVNHKLFKKID